ncbi:hypothetical protein MPSEU_000907600 [Mayamaea pseudoterrestris]|nr:hypothetical protein MPSEU_000907600 [Mayamaea pseudoterrestris]
MKSFILFCVCLALSSTNVLAVTSQANDKDSLQQTATLSKLRRDLHNRKLITKRQDRKGPLFGGSVSTPLSPLPVTLPKSSSKTKGSKGTKGPKASKAPKVSKGSKKAKGTKGPKASKAPGSKTTKGSKSELPLIVTRRNLQSSKGLLPSLKVKGTKGPKASKAPKGSKKAKGTKAPKSETVGTSGSIGVQRRALTASTLRAVRA